jgi:hypothetical protein
MLPNRQKGSWNSSASNGWNEPSRPGTADSGKSVDIRASPVPTNGGKSIDIRASPVPSSGARFVNGPQMNGTLVSNNRKIGIDGSISDERKSVNGHPSLLNGHATLEVAELERKLQIAESERDQAISQLESAQVALKREQVTVEQQRIRIEGLESQLADIHMRTSEAEEIKQNLHESETLYREQTKQNEMLLDMLAQAAAKNFEVQ